MEKYESEYSCSDIVEEIRDIPKVNYPFSVIMRFPYDIIDKLFKIQDCEEEYGGYVSGDLIKIEGRERRVANMCRIFVLDNDSDDRKSKYKMNVEEENEIMDDIYNINVYVCKFHTHPEGINPSISDLRSVTGRRTKDAMLISPDNHIFFMSNVKIPPFYLVWDNYNWTIDEQNVVGDTAPDKYPEDVHDVRVRHIHIDG